eukprot:PITA_04001
MQKKDQTFSSFCEFKALVEEELGKKIRALRSNNGGEYVSQEFKDFCEVEGIKWELTAPRNPQQNGVAERKNKTIVGAAWAMLHDQGLPLHLWTNACNTTIYLQNRSSHRILGMETLEETFSEERPDVGQFRIFGSLVYCHVTKDARKKLEPTTELGILATRVPLERELKLQAEEELLVPKEEEPQSDAEQLHVEVPGVETSTHAESSREGRKRTREADRLLMDARENVGEPYSQHRQRRSPERYTGYMTLAGECVETEPSSFEKVVQQLVWDDAMVEEYDSIVRNNVWDVVPRPDNKSVVSSHWIYKVKQVADGSVEKHKARFVSRGFSRVEGIDYDEIFAPVARHSSIRTMLVLSTQLGWKIHQMDVKTTFLNAKIEEEVYIEKLEGFETFDRESHVS